jgi:hypothetical protein
VADRSAALALIREGRSDEARALACRMETLYTAGSSDPLQLAEFFAVVRRSRRRFRVAEPRL